MKTFWQFIDESTDDLKSLIGKSKTARIISRPTLPAVIELHDAVFGKGVNHVHLDVNQEIPEKVVMFVGEHGDKLVDDSKVVLKNGREVPLAKYLSKAGAPKEVSDEFQNYARSAVSNVKLVISRNPGEVASMSCNTHWSSCADPRKDGHAAGKLGAEIKQGTLIAMLVHRDVELNSQGEFNGKDILGRVLIKRHTSSSGHVVFLPEKKVYGHFSINAVKVVDEFCKKNYPLLDALYKKNAAVYNDDGVKVKINQNVTDKQLSKILDNSDVDVRHTALKHPNINANHIHQVLSQNDNTEDHILAAKLPQLDASHMDTLSKSKFWTVRSSLAKHRNLPDNIFNRLAMDGDSNVRGSLASYTTSSERLHSLLNLPYPGTRSDVMLNDNINSTHIDKALDDRDINVRKSAIRSIKATPAHIDKALDDNERYVRECAIKNGNASSDNISKALKDYEWLVRIAAIGHPNATIDHAKWVMNNPYDDDDVKDAARGIIDTNIDK